MDLATKNLIFWMENVRKKMAQKMIDDPEFADNYQVGKTIDAIGKNLHQLRTGELNCDSFMDSIPEATEGIG